MPIKNENKLTSKNEIKLTSKNLVKYGDTVLKKSWISEQGSHVNQSYIIWRTAKMKGLPEDRCNTNKDKMFVLTEIEGEAVLMKEV